MSDQIPETPVHEARESLRERISIVWIVPLIALAVSLGIAWQRYSERGPLIEILFDQAAGIEAGKTELKFHDVKVGLVEDVGFTPSLSRVSVKVRLDKDVADFVDQGAQFWVVQPEISAQGITGLNTVISGVYIEGSWDLKAGGLHNLFVGFKDTPLARPDQEGTQIVLTADDGKNLREGTPIYYRGLKVGSVGKPRLADDGVTVLADAFVSAPQDGLLSSTTRFWNISGISFSLGPGGASVNFESVASLIAGGVSFDTVVSGGRAIDTGASFELYSDRDSALNSFFSDGEDGHKVQITTYFTDNVSGLNVGAPVNLRGLKIGEVTNLTGQVDPDKFGDNKVRLAVTMAIQSDQIAVEHEGTVGSDLDGPLLDYLEEQVAGGLRARLANASLLKNSLKIELVTVEDATPAVFDRNADPFPVLPSASSELRDAGATAEGLLNRVNKLPVEDLMASAVQFMDNASLFVTSDKFQSIPDEAAGLIGDVREFVQSDAVKALPEELTKITEDLRGVIADVRTGESVQKLTAAVEKAGEAAAQISVAAEGVPELINRIDSLIAKADGLDLEGLLGETKQVAASIKDILGSDSTKRIPSAVADTLKDISVAVTDAQAVLASIQDQDAVGRLGKAVDAAGTAATNVSDAVSGVPDLVAKIDGVADQIGALDVDEVIAQVADLSAAAKDILASDAAKALPSNVNAALTEMTTVMSDLREGGTVENVNETLSSASRAADSVASAASNLPNLVNRAEAVLVQANTVLASLAETGSLNKEAQEALRQVSRAAEAMRSLARTIERKPNALLTGR